MFVVVSGNCNITVLIRAQAKWHSKDTPKYNGLDNTEGNFSFMSEFAMTVQGKQPKAGSALLLQTCSSLAILQPAGGAGREV